MIWEGVNELINGFIDFEVLNDFSYKEQNTQPEVI